MACDTFGLAGFYVSNDYKAIFTHCTTTSESLQRWFVVAANKLTVRGSEECRLATMLEF